MKIRIALAQINPIVGDVKGNRKRVEEYVAAAVRQQADIVVFPELSICGYPPEDLILKPHFVSENMKELEELASKIFGVTAIIGFVHRGNDGKVYNAAAVISSGRIIGVYHKKELPNYSIFDEKRYFSSQDENVLFSFSDINFGVNICEDMWDQNGPYKEQVASGAKILFNISASPYHVGKRESRFEIMWEKAVKNKCYVCYVNLVGGQDELVFDGGSFIVGPDGKLVASAKEFEEDVLLADIEVKGTKERRKIKGLKVVSVPFENRGEKVLAINPSAKKKLPLIEEVYRALVLGTRDYVRKNGFGKVVLGLSGGIDSALTAALACDAVGSQNVIGVTMPSKYSTKATRKDAAILASNLGIRFLEIPINDVVASYRKILKKAFGEEKMGVVEENLQARIRGNVLMAFSNKYGWLVLTTGNKSETATGYCTLYGDMAGGFGVIKDVPKTLVYKLSEYVNKKGPRVIIPRKTIERAPTAELRPKQKDTDSLPPYDVLDPILKAYIENDRSFEEMSRKKLASNDVLTKVIGMVDRNEYKRRQAPPGIKITPKAFGKDRRLPITNRYRG